VSNFVVSADGTRLAVRERGNAAGPTIVCVHGFPDSSSLWDGVADLLAPEFRVVTYDVRGSGASDRPKETESYRLERLAEDLKAVGIQADWHILGHDWGSVQVWHALVAGLKAASFTSISGPELNRARAWMRAHRASRQTIASGYILLFQLPGVAEALSAVGLLGGLIKLIDPSRRGHPIRHEDVKHGLKLYRANMFRPTRTGPITAPITIPVQVLAPTRDPFVGVEMQAVEGAPLHRVREHHWVPLANPRFVAQRTTEFIGGIMSRAR
jgi:pimeloyl-ACP methyl ester carboxylesterase